MSDEPYRIANCSGFYGDRLTAAREMVDGGPIDVLTGDYLAELTMAILWRTRTKHPGGGYARTFLRQMEDVLSDCVAQEIRVVSNAGGLAPAALAAELRSLAADHGLDVAIAHITGDDLIDRWDELGEMLTPTPGAPPISGPPLTANAYLGGWGIARALDEGAGVVVTGRVTDAALVMGPAAHRFGWAIDDWDALAGALVAGHVIECGAQATGGNFSFFTEIPGLDHVGFPLVEMHADGSFVVTKHPGTGGAVTVETVTAQLLYEIGGPRYVNPDVVARFDTIRLTPDGPDRVRVDGVRGEPPPSTLKVAANSLGGYRNSVTFVLTGLEANAKAEAAETALRRSVGSGDGFDEFAVHRIGTPSEDPSDPGAAVTQLDVTVTSGNPEMVGRSFSGAAVEQALAGYPGFHLTAPPGEATPFAVYHPMTVPAEAIVQTVHMGERRIAVTTRVFAPAPHDPPPVVDREPQSGPTTWAPLGSVVGARSGDKGGDANVGMWVRDLDGWRWLRDMITVDWIREVLPEAADLPVDRYEFPNLGAINVVVRGLLGAGVAASTRFDPQAKALGEYLRSRFVAIPSVMLQV